MTPIDKNYLSLQFWNKVYQKNATEFQSFFEGIMQKAFPDFKKIRPYGNKGDSGNDGYIPAKGIYYQVYAPIDPLEKEAYAAKKFKSNFERLKEKWNQISTIKEYNFVFNDKGVGVTIELESARGELKKANQNVEFEVFKPKDLEQIFFTLSSDDILSLGFDVDSRNVLRIAHEFLEKLEVELDRENAKFVLKVLENIKRIIVNQNDENLILDYGIMEARALQKAERVKEAREKFHSIFESYHDDPRAPLHLAHIYLNNDDFGKNEELLKEAEQIDSTHWLLQLEEIAREIRLGNQFDVSKIDEDLFPSNPRIKSNYYRLYSSLIEKSGYQVKAKSYLERAISLNPDRFSNYDAKLSMLENRIYTHWDDKERFQELVETFSNEIEIVEQRISGWGDVGPRSKALVTIRKLHLFLMQENYTEYGEIAKETLELALLCYFDQLVDKIIADSIHLIELPKKDLLKLLNYLQNAEKPISEILAKCIILQFAHKNTLFTEGKKFFEKIKGQDVLAFINDIENENYENVLSFLKRDMPFTINFAIAIKALPELRRQIVEQLPNDGTIQKEKLFLLLDYEEGKLDDAFEILKNMDLSKLSYIECGPTLKVAQEKKAWEFVIILLEKLLQYEKEETVVLQIEVQLFTANLNLERFPEVIRIGRTILSASENVSLLSDQDKEMLLAQTVYAHIKRGEYPQAKELVEKYNQFLKTFEAKISVETEVYLRNNDPQNALKAVVEATKILKRPSPEQYGSLFFIFNQIGNQMDFRLISLDSVSPNCFVKLKGQDRWFLIGEENELDATKIIKTDEKYSAFIGKKIGEKISFSSKYRSVGVESEIENILPIEKYILWQSRHSAEKLSLEQRWDKIEVIEVPKTEGTIDTKYLVARLEEDFRKRGAFFDLYCQQAVPLALLATNEGSLTNAIGRIVNEGRGYIKASTGTQAELDAQKEVAKKIIAGQPFYIDGTSAFVLSETGLVEKIHGFLPNLKIPQSVISLLLEIQDKCRYTPGLVGYMAYSRGKITVSPFDRTRGEVIEENFEKSIKLLESKPENIGIISAANKSSCFSEQRVPPGLSDACILAQKENLPVLTEDFLYLKVNELETKRKMPPYCSSLSLLRVLYQQKKVRFEQYLDFFCYLSSYRFRFLPISIEDLEKAVFGDANIKVVRPEQLRKFNFVLTLSAEYGVSFSNSFILIRQFLVKILTDDFVLPEVTGKVFAEIISSFPTKDKKSFGKLLLVASTQAINKKYKGVTLSTNVKKKIDLLSEFIQTWSDNIVLL